MKNLIYIAVFILFSTATIKAQTVKTIVSGKYSAQKHTQHFKEFPVSKGDVVTLKVTSLHKKRGLNIWVKQNPGDILVFHYDNMRNAEKKITAPADAIYKVYFKGKKVDFEIEITNNTNKPEGPGKGDIVYVQIPDTNYVSGYVNYPIGESYTLTPYKEKVLLSVKKQPEQIISRDFVTGVDYIQVDIPGNIKDEYREQKLLSYSVTLTCGEISMYNQLMGVVDAGVDLASDKISGAAKNKMQKKTKKGSMDHQYQFTDKNLDDESSKLETVADVVELADEKSGEYAPESKSTELLDTIGFVLDGGIQKVVIEKAMDAAGVPKNIQAIYGTIQEFPDVAEIVKDNVHKLIPKVKGKAALLVEEKAIVTEKYPIIPEGKEFLIQSAMNYGKNQGAYLDVPGNPTVAKKGQNIQIWGIDGGIDRKFKIVPSKKYQGYYEILSALNGNFAMDVKNGDIYKNGTNIQIWERNNSDAQQFFFKHIGGGKFKIFTVNELLSLDNRKNSNGTNVHLWEDENGAWTEWYLVDPVTKKAFIPTENKTYRKWVRKPVINKKGGVINEIVKVDSTAGDSKKLYITIGQQGVAAKAKLLVEAEYQITDYTDVIKYKKTTQPVKTQDFWTAYKVNYHYQMMFNDQVHEGWNIISKDEFFNPSRPISEVINGNDPEQKLRLKKYDILLSKK